jgi:type IX secretion system PorP/SprF family membrane protein
MKTSLTTILIIPFFLLVNLNTQAQQDIHFAQFYELPMLRNPSLAGIFNGNIRFTAAYRNQWQSITVPYRTIAMGTEIKILRGLADGDFMTFGLQVTNDEAGDSKLRRTQLLPVINYHKLLNVEKSTLLSLAFMGGLVSERFDPTALKFDDQFVNGSYNTSNVTSQSFSRTGFSYLDANVGLSLSSLINENTKFYIGAALFHFNNPRLTFMKDQAVILNRKWGVNGGFTYKIGNIGKLVIYGDHFRQGSNRITQLGFLYSYNFIPAIEDAQLSISAGAIFRLNDAIAPVVKLNKDKWSLGLSYDTNISSLKKASNFKGGFEMTMSLIDPWKRDDNDTDKTKCPTNIW